jgi:hypothetical protein
MHIALVINVNLCLMSNTLSKRALWACPLSPKETKDKGGTNRFRPKIALNALIYNVL